MNDFDFLAYPWFIFSGSELLNYGEGTLFELPSDLPGSHVDNYKRITETGWTVCPRGFSVYSRRVDYLADGQSSGVLVLPGLRIKNPGSVIRKDTSFHVVSDKGVVVRHVDAVLGRLKIIDGRNDEQARQLMHEIRGINTGVYHAAVELEDIVTAHAKALATNISSLSQVLSARMDFVGFVAGEQISDSEYGKVAVFRKFDYMNRCFLASTAKRGLTMALKGASRSYTYGPKSLIDLAAYLMIENAIKYGPRGSHIDVKITEDACFIIAEVSSVGPKIDQDEAEKIFESGFRGRQAIASGVPGSGIGLQALKRIVADGFAGTVSVGQGTTFAHHGSVELVHTTFSVRLPIST